MIRQATAQDEVQIRECAEKAYERYVQLIGRKPAPMVADFATQIADGYVFVAMDDQGRFQGFIIFHAEERHILLENVAVLPRAIGRGVGKELVNFCENTTRERGLDAVKLYTNVKMTENLSMYSKLGYAEVGRRTEDGFNRVYFEKVLT
ncbi:GNAT family N-acetyltransferase [Paracoccus sp. JM45]|uniref:GNAT family N-acetyltransferase n=1 Tax=Paracoccus sp. JM45 TaxID=2283626 RepID=UPI000E6C6EFE|nr:GNAT family N-acetyltransferase [Paracoccus sp. JM45]RJE78746.1 GNAT family N-acetyltransferase [Paracoccus sp. JM45]